MDLDSERVHVLQDILAKARTRLEELTTALAARRGTGRSTRAAERLIGMFRQYPSGSILGWRIPRFTWAFHLMPMIEREFHEHLPDAHIRWRGRDKATIREGGRHITFIFHLAGEEERIEGIPDIHWVYDEGECLDYEDIDRAAKDVEFCERELGDAKTYHDSRRLFYL